MAVSKQLLNEVSAYSLLKGNGYNLELISGKWFLNGEEYSLYGWGGIMFRLCEIMPNYFGDASKGDRFIKWFINNCNREGGKWPELPIIQEARDWAANGKITELCYPLTEKELEIINYLLVGDPKDTYAIFFYGVGGSGKSTVCNLIASIFGPTDTSVCSFNEISNPFTRETIAGKRLWYDSDINAVWSERSSNTLKKIITHDTDQFQKKGKNPYMAQYRAKPLFCCNVPPRFDLTDSGLLRRILYYSKNEKIQNPDGSLANKEWSHEELVNVVAVALNHPFNASDFTKETHDIIISTNSVGKWGLDVDYDIYLERCRDNYAQPFGKDKFNTLKALFKQWQSN